MTPEGTGPPAGYETWGRCTPGRGPGSGPGPGPGVRSPSTRASVAVPGSPARSFDPAGPDGEVKTTGVGRAAPPVLNADEEEIRACLAGCPHPT